MPLIGTECTRLLPIMGFNFESPHANMLHDLAHRIEYTMTQLNKYWIYDYLNSPPNEYPSILTDFDKFTAGEKDAFIKPGCGNAHGSINSRNMIYGLQIDWSDPSVSKSTCDDFLNYPLLSGQTLDVGCSDDWSCDALEFFNYSLWHFPSNPGKNPHGLNNWWKYVIDYEEAIRIPLADASPIPLPSQLQAGCRKQSSCEMTNDPFRESCSTDNDCKVETSLNSSDTNQLATVLALNSDCTPIAPVVPTLLYPVHTSTIGIPGTQITLTWATIRDWGKSCRDEARHYALYVDTVNPPQKMVGFVHYPTSNFTLSVTPNTTYFWKMIATNGNLSQPSAISSFTVVKASPSPNPSSSPIASPRSSSTPLPITTPRPTPSSTPVPSPTSTPSCEKSATAPSIPTIKAPESGSSIDTTEIYLDWYVMNWGTYCDSTKRQFLIYVDTANPPQRLEAVRKYTESDYHFSGLSNTTYYFQIVADNGNKQSISEIRSFTTGSQNTSLPEVFFVDPPDGYTLPDGVTTVHLQASVKYHTQSDYRIRKLYYIDITAGEVYPTLLCQHYPGEDETFGCDTTSLKYKHLYWWHVEATNEFGKTVSPYRGFNVGKRCEKKPKITLESPLHKEVLNSDDTAEKLTSSVTYNTCSGVRTKEVWIRNKTLKEPFDKLCKKNESVDGSSSCIIKNLVSGYTYEWYVTAKNEGVSSQSAARRFSVGE